MTDDQALLLAHEAALAWGGCPAPRLIKNRENAVFDVVLPTGRATATPASASAAHHHSSDRIASSV